MQDTLNDMGATAVMLQALVDGGTDPLVFRAGLGLGRALLEGLLARADTSTNARGTRPHL